MEPFQQVSVDHLLPNILIFIKMSHPKTLKPKRILNLILTGTEGASGVFSTGCNRGKLGRMLFKDDVG